MTQLHTTYYTVPDVGRATQFYSKVLNLQVSFTDADRWAQFNTPRGAFALSSVEESASGIGRAVAVFTVDNLDQIEAVVTALGARVVSRRDMGAHGRTLAFADPDDNIVQLLERAK